MSWADIFKDDKGIGDELIDKFLVFRGQNLMNIPNDIQRGVDRRFLEGTSYLYLLHTRNEKDMNVRWDLLLDIFS